MVIVIDEHSIAKRINESGQILAEGDAGAIRVVPFAAPEYFPTVGFPMEGDMNDSGHFVGRAVFEVPINKKRTTTVSRAVRHDGTSMLDLGAGDTSWATGINYVGDVVGIAQTRPFVYYEGLQQVVNLDNAVEGDEVELMIWNTASVKPIDINDAGQIIGDLGNDELLGSGLHAFVLTPIP